MNATGSQASLWYDIDFSLTQIPENLIFYYDEQMTNAMYKENGKIHLDGYFQADSSNKTETKMLYWSWKLETGTTADEIDANDALDSWWMGRQITLGIEAKGKQITEEPATQYAVTFDLNGGTLENHGDTTQITKQVNYGEAYGALPTPTRVGYRFMGWNGKNMFDYDTNSYDRYSTIKQTINGEQVYKRNMQYMSTYNLWSIFHPSSMHLEKGKTYTISFDIWSDYEVNFTQTRFYVNDSTRGEHNLEKIKPSKQRFIGTFTCGNDLGGLIHIYHQVYADNNYYIANILVEESGTATPYEPYYVISTTPVTQNKNHTLTAIWKAE